MLAPTPARTLTFDEDIVLNGLQTLSAQNGTLRDLAFVARTAAHKLSAFVSVALYSRRWRIGWLRLPRVASVLGMSGMKFTRKRRIKIIGCRPVFLGIAGVAFVTFLCFHIGFGIWRTSCTLSDFDRAGFAAGQLCCLGRSINRRRRLPELLLRAAIV